MSGGLVLLSLQVGHAVVAGGAGIELVVVHVNVGLGSAGFNGVVHHGHVDGSRGKASGERLNQHRVEAVDEGKLSVNVRVEVLSATEEKVSTALNLTVLASNGIGTLAGVSDSVSPHDDLGVNNILEILVHHPEAGVDGLEVGAGIEVADAGGAEGFLVEGDLDFVGGGHGGRGDGSESKRLWLGVGGGGC